MEDDVYRGYFLPKGTLFITNIWFVASITNFCIRVTENVAVRYMTRDPDVYSDPLEFKPERFLEGGGRVPEQDPRYSVFGFGRR